MKELYVMGGVEFMGFLTLLFVIMVAWFTYHLVRGFSSNQVNKEKLLKKIEYGKSIALFALIVGFLGQMIGFVSMFEACAYVHSIGEPIQPHLVFAGIRSTMIVPMYGILIYLFSLLIWFTSSLVIEKKFES